MMEPCIQAENVSRLFVFHDEKMKQLSDIREHQILIESKVTMMASEVSHIKERIDNGLSHAVTDMHLNLTKLMPVIDGHTRFIDRFQDVLIASVKTFMVGLGISIIGLFAWAIANGLVLK